MNVNVGGSELKLYLLQVPNFPHLYRLHKLSHPKRGKIRSSLLSQELVDDVRVMWAEQQFAKRRQKRGYLPFYPPFETEISETEKDRPLKRVKRKLEAG